MGNEEIIKKLEKEGFSANMEQSMVYVDLTKVEAPERELERLRGVFKAFGYRKSFGVKYKNK